MYALALFVQILFTMTRRIVRYGGVWAYVWVTSVDYGVTLGALFSPFAQKKVMQKSFFPHQNCMRIYIYFALENKKSGVNKESSPWTSRRILVGEFCGAKQKSTFDFSQTLVETPSGDFKQVSEEF